MSPKLAGSSRGASRNGRLHHVRPDGSGRPADLPRSVGVDPEGGVDREGDPGGPDPLRKEDGALASPGEVGEIVAEGENVMAGYWKTPMTRRRC